MNKPVGRALIQLHEALMRSDSPLTPAQHEMIAAFVSGLNECQYCVGVHAETAQAFGLPEGLLQKMVVDLEGSPVEPNMLPLLQYVRLLTQAPHQLVQADADKGWSERALHDAVLTTCLFNFMNRLLEGHGAKGSAEVYRARGQALKDAGYGPLLAFLK
jgi:uncharacterized peroxidase-related enzyme